MTFTNRFLLFETMDQWEIKQYLFERLKDEKVFWSYEEGSLNSIEDDLLIELVLQHLDLDDIELLFTAFGREKVKSVWLGRLIPQGEYLRSLNKFIAWYYFGIKKPGPYVKMMYTKHLNKI